MRSHDCLSTLDKDGVANRAARRNGRCITGGKWRPNTDPYRSNIRSCILPANHEAPFIENRGALQRNGEAA